MTFKVVLFNDSDVTLGFTRAAGPYAISTILNNLGYETLVVNYSCLINFDKFKKIVELSIGKDTLIVGFSTSWFDSQKDLFSKATAWEDKSISINFQRKNINPYIEYIRNINPNVKVIAGGFTAHSYIDQQLIDNIFIGFSESQIVDYVNDLTSNKVIPRIINNDVKATKFNFNSSKIEYSKYDLVLPEEIQTIEFARGCIFKCSFCSYPMIGSKTKDYLKYQEVIYEELLTNYEKWGIKHYFIADDTFNDSVEKLKLISEVIERLPFKPEFGAYVRIDLLASHPEMAELLKKINIVFALYGLETWNTETSRMIKKGGTQENKIKAFKIAKECWGNNVFLWVSMISGLPNDTVTSINEFLEWYEQDGFNYIDHVNMAPLSISIHSEKNPYVIFLSDIDTNKEKYNYKFTDDSKVNNNIEFFGSSWVKQNQIENGIQTREQAHRVADEFNRRVQQIHRKNNKGHPPVLGSLKDKFNVESFDPGEIVKVLFERDYYPNFIRLLEERIKQ